MPKNVKTQNLLIELIELSAGTQTRPLDDETVRIYAEFISDHVTFPPIEVIWDGEKYIPYDGFHRIAAHKRLGRKNVRANIHDGTTREAIWLSFSVNKAHGLPRQKGVKEQILTQIFQDKEWSTKSISEIARHVGCSRDYASEVKNRPQKGVDNPHPFERAKEVKVRSKKGKVYKQKSQEKEHQPKHPLKDESGQIIPETLTDRYLSRAVIQERIRDLDKIKNFVLNSIHAGELTFGLILETAFQSDCANLRNRLSGAVFFAVCPYCSGPGCKGCHGTGFLNRESFEAAPKFQKDK